jgi:predicted GH43/DUF377 family glycosyl hydrolase
MKTNSNINLLLMGLILFTFITVNSSAQLNWVKCEGNPIIEGSLPEWDVSKWYPVVIHEDGLFKMWYGGYNWQNLTHQIGYGVSEDGITWSLNDDPVIPSGAPGAWDRVRMPGTVLRINDTLRMWYVGSTLDWATRAFGYAWAVEENNWNVLPDPVLVKGEPGTWDDYSIMNYCVHYDGAIYHMFYTGIGQGVKIGYATSIDGINWDKDYEHSPVISLGENGTFYDEWVMASGLVVYNDTIRMFFTGYDGTTIPPPEYSYYRVGYAWSTDYVNWTVENNMEPVVDVGAVGSWDERMVHVPSVIVHDGRLKMWYTGYTFDTPWKIGYALGDFITGLPDKLELMPAALSITPNPFKDDVTLTYQLQEKSTVQLDVYNYSGQLISSLLNDVREQGNHEVFFDGAELQPGVYFCVLKTNEGVQTKKLIKL